MYKIQTLVQYLLLFLQRLGNGLRTLNTLSQETGNQLYKLNMHVKYAILPDVVMSLNIHLLKPLSRGFLAGISHSKHYVPFHLKIFNDKLFELKRKEAS